MFKLGSFCTEHSITFSAHGFIWLDAVAVLIFIELALSTFKCLMVFRNAISINKQIK